MTLANRFRLKALVAAGILAMTALTACDSPEERVQSHMQRGIEFLEAENYEAARIEFKNALQINATNGKVYYYLGRIHDARRRWSEAMRAFRQAVNQSPDLIDANIWLGRYYVLAGDLPKALARAEHIIFTSEGDNVEGYALRASVYLAQEQLEQAKADARSVLAREPGNATATGVMAGIYRRENQSAEAIEVLSKGIEMHPNNVALRLTKIGIHLKENQRKEAEKESLALLAIEPNNLDYRISVARLYVGWERLDDAEKVLRDAVDRQTDGPEAKLAYIDFLANRRSFAIAKQALEDFIEEEPKNYTLRFALAELHQRNNQRTAAMDVLKDIIALEPENPHAFNAKAALAGLLYAEDRIPESKKMVDEVLQVEPKNLRAMLVRAHVEVGENRLADAIESLRTVLRDEPDSRAALTLLGRAYLGNGQRELAMDTLRRLIEVDRGDNETRVHLAQMLASDGKLDAALRLLNEALERAPRHVPIMTTKVDILVLLGRFAEAEEVVEMISQLPNGEFASLMLNGRAAAAQGRHKEALASFQRAHAMAPDDWQPITGIVRTLARQNDIEKAGELLSEVVENQPKNEKAWILLGDLLRAKGKHDSAIKAYRSAVDVEPASKTAHMRLAGLHFQLGDKDGAINSLERLVAINAADVEIRTTLALALENAERFDEAIKVYEKMEADGVRELVVANNLSALVADHAFHDSERLARRLKRMKSFETSSNALIIDTIGWLHFRVGNFGDAVSFLKRAVTLDPKNALLQRHLGLAYRKAGDTKLAEKHLTTAAELSESAADRATGGTQ